MTNRVALCGLLLCVALGMIGGSLSTGLADEKGATPAKKERAKAKGYLPPFYRDVIDGLQREKIYKIQDEYDDKIDALRAEANALEAKRDGEISALLTPEQKKRLDELASEAKVKRAADEKAKKSTKAAESDAKAGS